MRYAILLAPLLALLILACRENDRAPAVTSTPTEAAAEQPPAADDGERSSGKLAFSSCIDADGEGGGPCNIYVGNADGSGFTRTIDGGRWAVWSPDGSRFAFWGEDEQLSVANADGSGLLRLAESLDQISLPAWSPDGTQIVFVRGQDNLAVVAADGSGQPTFIENPAADYYLTPAWSPDGRRIVFQFVAHDPFDIELYLINPDFSGLTRLTDMEATPSFPTWSPDGSRIAFAAEGDIYVVNADGSGLTNLTSSLAGDNYPVWSPDGSRIAFSSCAASERGETCGVSVVNADGSDLTNIAEIACCRPAWPAWSPDGARIAFPSCEAVDEAGKAWTCTVYVVNADGSGLNRFEAPANGFVSIVAWSPVP